MTPVAAEAILDKDGFEGTGIQRVVAEDGALNHHSREDPEAARRVFVELLESRRQDVLEAYRRAAVRNVAALAEDNAALEQSIVNVGQILSDVVASVRAGLVVVDENHKLTSRDIGESRAAAEVPTRESWQASLHAFEVVADALVHNARPGDAEAMHVGLLSLNRSLSARMREATGAYTSFLLHRISEAHAAERRRIARELHDRIGNGLSDAHNRLDLIPPEDADGNAQAAHQAVLESLESLRVVTSDLRLSSSLKSLEKALLRYVESVRRDGVTLHLRVNGDEAWAPPPVRDEVFLIVREAIRNALNHADPSIVLVGVDIAPHELRAIVENNGAGFDLRPTDGPDGTGLVSMRERAALIGGRLLISSEPDQGTLVELITPLPERREQLS